MTDLLIDLRPHLVRTVAPMPLTPQQWQDPYATSYDSDEKRWSLRSVVVNHQFDDPGQQSGFFRFSSTEGFRFTIAVHKNSGDGALPTRAICEVLPSLRMVLSAGKHQQALRHSDVPSLCWEYTLDGLAAAVRNPAQWLNEDSEQETTQGADAASGWTAASGSFAMPRSETLLLLAWALAGRTRADAEEWAQHGFSPTDVIRWLGPTRQQPWSKFTAQDAKDWAPVFGVNHPDWAHPWRKGKFRAAEVTYWLTHRELRVNTQCNEMSEWARIDDPARRHAYMCYGFSTYDMYAMEEEANPGPDVETIRFLGAMREVGAVGASIQDRVRRVTALNTPIDPTCTYCLAYETATT